MTGNGVAATPVARFAALVGLGAVLIIATLLRVWLLGSPELFRDEAASWLLARADWGQIIPRSFAEPYPPLYPFALKATMGLLGDGTAALRALSVAAGIGLVAVTWLWARAAIGQRAAIIASGIVALSPLAIANARLVRMYALEALCVTVAWWLIWRLVTDGRPYGQRPISVVGAALALAAELWTLPTGIVAFGLQLVAVLILARTHPTRGASLATWSLAGGAILFLPWVPRLVALAANGQPFWTVRPNLVDLASTFGAVFGSQALVPVAAIVAVTAMPLAGIGWWAVIRSSRPDALGTALALGGGIGLAIAWWLASLWRPAYDVRYMGPLVPPLAIATGAGVEWFWKQASRWRMRWRGVAIVVAAAVLALFGLGTVRFEAELIGGPVDPAEAAVGLLAREVARGDLVLASDAQSFLPIAYLIGRSSDPIELPVPVRYWRSGLEVTYTGGDLVPAELVIQRSARLDELVATPGGSIWLVAITYPEAEVRSFAALTGLTELNRLEVSHNGARGLLVRFRPTR
jgi:4-amino-4-deoxy-L-arabinose transferase-like glycosyltransferase